jgi:hypothetical protein
MMFKIVRTGRGGDETRLVAKAALTRDDFRRIAGEAGSGRPVRARKTGLVAARRAGRCQVVETRWNGTETTNTARRGDWIVTNLTREARPLRDAERRLNAWVIPAQRFPSLYEPTGGDKGRLGAVYRATSVVEAIFFPGGFDIVTPWGERQTAASGWLIRNGDAVYGNHADTFAATYEVVPPPGGTLTG